MLTFLENFNKYFIGPLFAIVATVYGFFMTTVKDNLETIEKTQTIELTRKGFDTDLKFKLFDEVRLAISEGNPVKLDATLKFLDIMLADDSKLNGKFRLMILGSKASPEIKEKIIDVQKQENDFKEMQNTISMSDFTIDVFYLEENANSTVPIAKAIQNAIAMNLPGISNLRVRIRKLPPSINAKSGYLISANELRCETSENQLADKILSIVNDGNILKQQSAVTKQIITYNTPKYISVFIANP